LIKPINNTVTGSTWLAADVDDAADVIAPNTCFVNFIVAVYYSGATGSIG
jgi:hypothetical protein